ncbi:MAG: hypothetical protein JNK82_01755 [Myxococcaceae bacterium]|nr:hypothetical protein [Myxococcaceae bacterium]
MPALLLALLVAAAPLKVPRSKVQHRGRGCGRIIKIIRGAPPQPARDDRSR